MMGRFLLPVMAAGTLTVALAGAPVSAAAVGTSGPATVALWHLDEQPGAAVAVDSSGRGHHGAISADVLLGVPGQFGTAFEFPGPSAKITVPSADDLNPHQSPLTVSAYLWVPNSLTGGDYNTPTARSTLPAGPRTASTDRSGSTTAPGTRSSVTSPTPRPMSPSTASRARSRPERSGASPTRSR